MAECWGPPPATSLPNWQARVMAHRYALYYSPPGGSLLGSFGATWLGRTIEGQDLGAPALRHVSAAEWKTATTAVSRYGFHATLKPPFRLADGCTEADLIASVEEFCSETVRVTLGDLKLGEISGFLALRPDREPSINRLAADIVREFDCYRAPLTPQEIARRNPDALTPVQRDVLDRWGYPYVMGEFRFHMTLTDRLASADAEKFRSELAHRLPPGTAVPASVDDICIFREDRPGGNLTLLRRVALQGS